MNSHSVQEVFWKLIFGYSPSDVFDSRSMLQLSRMYKQAIANTAVWGGGPDLCLIGSNSIMHVSSGILSNFSKFHFSQGVVFTSISDDIWGVIRENPLVCIFLSVQRIEQVFPRTRSIPLIGHTMHTHTDTHTYSKSLMVVFRPGRSHIEQTVMRKRITVFHQQLSPAAPVRLKCAYIAAGHAVAKEVLVSKQELAGKHPQS